eukprot:TRINITY_DN2952_c0_g1_i6.p1 TRINITY_DN2952_c0_g1~~TRINITY_DN2952_c0_g1_i6.p1  ORF type:complete len:220 (+),score=-27.04 TRINITY_DN2952_c0_g1_i6:934-1593(+)
MFFMNVYPCIRIRYILQQVYTINVYTQEHIINYQNYAYQDVLHSIKSYVITKRSKRWSIKSITRYYELRKRSQIRLLTNQLSQGGKKSKLKIQNLQTIFLMNHNEQYRENSSKMRYKSSDKSSLFKSIQLTCIIHLKYKYMIKKINRSLINQSLRTLLYRVSIYAALSTMTSVWRFSEIGKAFTSSLSSFSKAHSPLNGDSVPSISESPDKLLLMCAVS